MPDKEDMKLFFSNTIILCIEYVAFQVILENISFKNPLYTAKSSLFPTQ